MNNSIDQFEEQFYEAPQSSVKVPCKKCGKPISNRGKRMHDMSCYGANSVRRSYSTRSASKSPVKTRSVSLKNYTPGSVLRWIGSTYVWFLDIMYQLLINNPFFFWIWGSLIVAYLVLPVYMVFVLFSYVEHFFGMLTILWKGGRTIVGGVVGFIDQTNQIAESLSSGGIVNVTSAVVNKYLPGKDADSKAISGFI